MNLDVLGCGLAFPLVPDATGRMPVVAGADAVRQAIVTILDTEPGERVMRPTFGCGLRRYLMAPNDVATRALIKRDVEQSLAQWERRIDVSAVVVAPGVDPALVNITVEYVVRRDQRPGNIVYPFFLS